MSIFAEKTRAYLQDRIDVHNEGIERRKRDIQNAFDRGDFAEVLRATSILEQYIHALNELHCVKAKLGDAD